MIDKYIATMKLSAIGDSLGWITEFESNIFDLERKYNRKFVDKFINWEKKVGGRFNGYIDYIKSGSYSDDTQLILSISRSIELNGAVNNEYFSKIELPSWLMYSRGGGRTLKNAALKLNRKSASWNNNFFSFKVGNENIDYRDCGANGAAMRILPIVLANFYDKPKIYQEVFNNSIITHGHPRAIIGALLYAIALVYALDKDITNFEPFEYLTEIGLNFKNIFSIENFKNETIQIWINKWNEGSIEKFENVYNYVLDESLNFLRLIYFNIKHNVSDHLTFNKIGGFDYSTKGSGIGSVILGIYLFCKYNNDGLDGVFKAVNLLGSDTDTIAAFTGALLGSLHGTSIISSDFNSLQDSKYIENISTKLYKISLREYYNNNDYFDLKYKQTINRINKDDFEENQTIYFLPLGKGTILNIERVKTLSSTKYNLILFIEFDLGQTCKIKKLLNV